jgi:hypothetical protein
MSSRPEVVDAQGGPMTGNAGGPMPLAKPAARWSHVAGKRQTGLGERSHRSRYAPGLSGRAGRCHQDHHEEGAHAGSRHGLHRPTKPLGPEFAYSPHQRVLRHSVQFQG